mmetsp:Transcript_15031/g.36828  ORF Transcript_15031/g.36828 Transcript_15031/m.36828 type:complete len:223 (+) Transcript_15031:393-1061(+)
MKAQNTISALNDCKLRWAKFPKVSRHCDLVVKAILTPKLDLSEVDKMLETEINVELISQARRIFGDTDGKANDEQYVLASKYRNFLFAGAVLKWHKSTSVVEDAHVQVSRDLKRLTWYNPQKRGVKQSVGVWKIRRVKNCNADSGFCKKRNAGFKTKAPLEHRALIIYSDDILLHIECPAESVRDRWIKTLQALVKHHKSSKTYATEILIREQKQSMLSMSS